MKMDSRSAGLVLVLSLLVWLGIRNHNDSLYFAPVNETTAASNAAAIDEVVKLAAEKVLETRKDAILLHPSMLSLSEADSYFGGIPTRFEGDIWPTNKVTGKPLTFVFQIAKNDTNKDFMGNIELFRLFLDYESNMDNDPLLGDVQILITESGDERIESEWDQQILDQLESSNPKWGEQNLIHAKQNLVGLDIVTGSNETLEKAREHVKVDNFELWWDLRVNAIKELKRLRPELVFPQDESVLGGNPYWVQSAAPQDYPFFIQLVPSEYLSIGDGGHVYIFLDKYNPTTGFGYSLQMY